MSQVRRRQFLIAAGALAVVPLASGARQTGRVKRVGGLWSGSRQEMLPFLKSSLEQGLRELGYVEGRDFVTEYRFANRQRERLPELAADLVRLKVDVIVTGTDPGTIAARQASGTIPIVMTIGGFPVELGLVASLRRPGGNVTGLVYTLDPEIFSKRLELLKEILPGASRLGVLWHPELPGNEARWKATDAAARKLGMSLLSAPVREARERESAFTKVLGEGAQAVLVIGDSFALFDDEIPALAARSRLPTFYTAREAVIRGGLMSYNASIPDLFRRAATYVDKILKGADPGELPVEQPTKFDLVINLKAAKAIGLTIPQSILSRADELIE